MLIDSNLHYTLYPNRQAKYTMVFIHGFGCSSSNWLYQLPYFYMHYQLLTLDLPGHGNSKLVAGEVTIMTLAQEVIKLIKSLNLKTPLILVGHSLGVRVVVEIYNQGNDLKFAALALLDCGYTTIKIGDFNYLQQQLFPNGYSSGIKQFFAQTFTSLTPIHIQELILKDVKLLPKSVGRLLLPNVQIYDYYYLPNALARINIPVLIMQATLKYQGKRQSIAVNNVEFSAWLNLVKDKLQNNQIHLVLNSGHFLMLEKPDLINSQINEFLSSSL